MSSFNYKGSVYDWKPSKWRGRKRRKPVEPFFVFHTSESRWSNESAEAVKKWWLGHFDYGGYHYIFDNDSRFCCGDPVEMRMYHSRRGGSDGIGIAASMKTAEWRTLDGRMKWWIRKQFSECVLDAEEKLGVKVEREHHSASDYNKMRKAGTRRGFFGHAETDPTRRTDPGWSEGDWRRFFKTLKQTEEKRYGKPEPEPVPNICEACNRPFD